MKIRLPSFHEKRQMPQKTLQAHSKMIEPPVKQPQVIQNKTFLQFRSQLKSIEQKIKELNTKRYSSKQNQWRNLKHDISEILSSLRLKKLRKILERKFEEQIRLLNDFYTTKYRKSMFRFCFLCCPVFIIQKFKYYKFIDEVFEKTISEIQTIQRNLYFYINLLYIKLFTMMVAVDDRLKEEFNKKMIEAMAVESKQHKITQMRKKQVGELQEINDVFVMEEENFKNLDDQNKIVASYIIQSDNPNQIKAKTQPREPFNTDLIKQNYYDEFKKLQQQIQSIISNDWKDIINCEEWSSQSYKGFIQINSDPPIFSSLQFKDWKLKTSHLFERISSSSFDLRTYLIRNQKKTFARQQYILNSLNQDSFNFKLTFWLSQSDNTQINNSKIQKFLLLAMRIGIKQKISRTCSQKYKSLIKKWMIHNYVHMNENEKSKKEKDSQNRDNPKSETSYRSLSQNSQRMTPQKFWWLNLGEALIKAIVEVVNNKIAKRRDNLTQIQRASFKKKSTISNQEQINPESIDRLIRPPNLDKKHYHSAKQI